MGSMTNLIELVNLDAVFSDLLNVTLPLLDRLATYRWNTSDRKISIGKRFTNLKQVLMNKVFLFFFTHYGLMGNVDKLSIGEARDGSRVD